jgi:hypothetical protein
MHEKLSLDDRISIARYRVEVAGKRLDASRLLLREGFYNDAVSKAYFAVHAVSRAILILHDIRATTHEGVKTMLSKELVRDAHLLPQDFSKKYSMLKALRDDVDYEDFISFTEEDAREAVDIAAGFMEKVTTVIEDIITERKQRGEPEDA